MIKSIAYKLLYMLSGAQLLFAFAVMLVGREDAWQFFVFSLIAYWIAYNIDRETKTPPR